MSKKPPTFIPVDPQFLCGPGEHRLRFVDPTNVARGRYCVDCPYHDRHPRW